MSAPEQPFTIADIGCGDRPLIAYSQAPDVIRLFEEGGLYHGLDGHAGQLS